MMNRTCCYDVLMLLAGDLYVPVKVMSVKGDLHQVYHGFESDSSHKTYAEALLTMLGGIVSLLIH